MTEETQEQQEAPQIPEEQVDAPEITTEEVDNTPTVEDYNKLVEHKNKMYARAKAAETELKKLREQAKTEINQTNTPSAPSLTEDEVILYAKGHTKEEVAMAKKLAFMNNVPILEAIEDEYLKSKVEKRIQKERSAKASLGASAGTPRYQPPKPIAEMTEAEHREFAKKVMNG